jgi:membrane associated rhomboid family serine protease
VAEVDLNVVCKHCGAEVSPYITECPYCGQRLRKRAPKLKPDGVDERSTRPKRMRLRRPRRRARERPLEWLQAERPYATIALALASAAVYLVDRASDIGPYDLGAVIGDLDGDAWRVVTTLFVYDNVGYLLAVAIALGIFGWSLERRYGPAVPLVLFLGAGALGAYLATIIEDFPVAFGGNGAALGLLCGWLVRDLRDRRAGEDTESDLLGVAAIAAVLALMPLLETTADGWAGAGGAAVGALAGLALPQRR